MSTRVAFLGPKGTYGEKAATALAKLENLKNPEFIPCINLHSVIEHTASELSDAAVVPIENSIEGGVTASLDALWKSQQLFIRRAIVLPIQHSLLSHGTLAEISEVLSHPQALAQCNIWLNTHLPNVLQLPTSSTAEAVRMVSGSTFRAAIASKDCNKDGHLRELAYPINDVAGNCTRFLLLDKKLPQKKGEISSLAFSLHANIPGALLKSLSCIANLGLNMSRIESRPSKRELGEYVFFIDVEIGGKSENIIIQLLENLEPLCEHLVHFGSYPTTEIQQQ